MLRTDRMASAVRTHGRTLITAGTGYLAGATRGRAKRLLYAGTALAVAGGVSSGSAAALASASTHPARAVRTDAASAARARREARYLAAALDTHGSPGSSRPVTTTTSRNQAAKPTAPSSSRPAAGPVTWSQVMNLLNEETNPAAAADHEVPAADQLIPVGTTGPQLQMSLGPAQVANATIIVERAIAMKMGVRAAVIAVATAMQESMLQNLSYGTADSLGLFQQRPSMGWGTAAQILDPAHSADAFLSALRAYEASNPGWATQPLWEVAQGVQASANPLAYAQWESQAANLVRQIAMQVVHV